LPLSTGKLSWRNFPKGSRSTCRSPTWNRYRARGALAAQRGMVGDDGAGTGRDLGETAVADQRQRQVSGEQRSPAVRGRGADRQGEVTVRPPVPGLVVEPPPGELRGVTRLRHRLPGGHLDIRVEPHDRRSGAGR